jgi:ankyrin repeat protein
MKGIKWGLLVLIIFGVSIKALAEFPLHDAIKAGNAAEVKRLVQLGYDINTKTAQGHTPLHYATWDGNLEMVNLLLGLDANPDLGDATGYTPLMGASQQGHLDVVKALIAGGANPWLQYQKPITSDLSTPKDAYNVAGDASQMHVVDYLHKVMYEDQYPATGRVLIMLARNKEYGVLKNALNSDFDPTAKDWNGVTALMAATTNITNGERWMDLFLDHKGDVKVTDKFGRTALHHAAMNGSYDAISVLLKHGADMEAVDSSGKTPLLRAAWHRGVDPVKALVDAGAKIDAVDAIGDNALMLTMKWGKEEKSLEVAKVLLENNIPVNLFNKENVSALTSSIFYKKMECAKLLLAHGADPSLTGTDGFTPAIQAVFLNDHDIASEFLKLLLEKKPTNLNSKFDGKTAMMIAKEKGHDKCLEMLKEAGATE